MRRAVDLCHCDGEIKDPVAIEPGRYIRKSPQLARMLAQLRLGGTQVPSYISLVASPSGPHDTPSTLTRCPYP